MARVVTHLVLLMGSLIFLFATAPISRADNGGSIQASAWSGGRSQSQKLSATVVQSPVLIASGTALVPDSAATSRPPSTDATKKTDETSQSDPNPELQSCFGQANANCPPKKCPPGHNDDANCRKHKSGDD